MTIRAFTLQFALAAALYTADPKPAAEFQLSSSLSCNNSGHTPIAMQFAPSNDLIALALQHNPQADASPVHLVVFSRSGKIVQHISGLQGPVKQRSAQDDDLLWWSADSKWVGFAGFDSVFVFQVNGAERCELPVKGADPRIRGRTQFPLGFLRGPMFATTSSPVLNLYSPEFKFLKSVPLPPDFEHAAISFEGEYLALMSEESGHYWCGR